MKKLNEGQKEIVRFRLRRSGKTTRIIDAAIQELFVMGQVTAKDHGTHKDKYKDIEVFKLIQNRLQAEHRGSYQYLSFNKKKLTITVKDKSLI